MSSVFLKSKEITEDEPQDDVEIEFLQFEGVFIQNIKEYLLKRFA